jgi:hypothetical protein
MQGIAPGFKSRYGVRVSAVLPGAVATNFLAGGEWPPYPPEYFTPVSLVASVVEALSAGEKPLEDAWGNKVAAGEDSGLAVEVAAGDRIYFRRPHEFCDETMRLVMGGVTRKARER